MMTKSRENLKIRFVLFDFFPTFYSFFFRIFNDHPAFYSNKTSLFERSVVGPGTLTHESVFTVRSSIGLSLWIRANPFLNLRINRRDAFISNITVQSSECDKKPIITSTIQLSLIGHSVHADQLTAVRGWDQIKKS